MVAANKVEAYLSSLELPDELKQVPQANVGFVGLDPNNNDTHKQILETFTGSRKSDRLSIHYSVIPADRDFPPAKAKRTTYEWFLPKGIIKRRWMNKHLFELPAVVIIFFDLDWGDQAWNEKAIECSSRVKAIRAALTTQQTRLAVVLVQRSAAGDDPLTAERAAELCSVCDLPPKSLWVLPATDHLSQYAMRLESAFYELALTYYHQRVKAVRAHRELLNKSHHQALFVRHQFKLGFFSEIRQDMGVAYKAYQQAYSHLLELRTTDLTLCEIKVVAAMLSFKVCRLAFRQNLPRDAIAHFRRHVELFRARVGPPELAVEHSGWLGQQYQWFGEVFDQAIHMGLPAIQTQHPGLYFEQAALHGRRRRCAAQQLQLDADNYPAEDPLSGLLTTEFFGQRPWRPPGRNVELMDAEKEKRGVLALQVMECCVSHHNLVIPLLSSAISHYKQYRCPRMKERLLVFMAEEYALSGDHDKAVILLSKVLRLYQTERWSPLAAQVAGLGLRSACASCQPAAYLTMAAALLACGRLQPEQRQRVDANVHRLLQRKPPESEPDCEVAADGWAESLAVQEPLLLELAPPHSLLACRAAFAADRYPQGSPLQVSLQLENVSAAQLQLGGVSVTVSGRTAQAAGGGALAPAERRALCVEVPPRLEELGSVAWLETVAVRLGGGDALPLELCWKLQLGDEQLHRSMFGVPGDGAGCEVGGLWTAVVPRPPRVTLRAQHVPPALVGEVYSLAAELECDLSGDQLTDLTLDLALIGADEETARHTLAVVGETSQPLSAPVSVPCGSLAAGSSSRQLLGLQCLTPASRQLQLTARYTELTETGGCQGRVTHSLQLDVVQPFQMSVRSLSVALEPVETVGTGQTVLMVAQITNAGPHSVRLRSTQLLMDDTLFEAGQDSVPGEPSSEAGWEDEDGAAWEDADGAELCCGALRQLTLQPGESASECVAVAARQVAGTSQPGAYTVTWNRLSEDARPVSTVSATAALQVAPAPLQVALQLPAVGEVRRRMEARYTVTNHSLQLYSLLLQLDASEAFMFAGNKRYQLRVAPGGSRTLVYQLYPLLSGRVTLPRPRLSLYRDGAPVDAGPLLDAALRQLPTHVYVMPQGKGGQHPAGGPPDSGNRTV